jgi:5'-AMP-activated protein kinase, catalytic alpha subunit
METPTLSKVPGTMVGIDSCPIDVDILKSLKEHQIDLDYARKCLEANKKNHATASYYLLLKKHIKAGGESVADARKPTYDPSIFMKRVPNFKKLLVLEQ